MAKKEIPITFVPSHLDEWRKHWRKEESKERADSKDNALIVLLVLGISILLVYFAPFFTFAVLAVFFVIAVFLWLNDWIKFLLDKKKDNKVWGNWLKESEGKGYYKLDYDEEAFTLFERAAQHEYRWTDIKALYYNEDYVYFHYEKFELSPVFPRQTLGDVNYLELLNLAKIKIMRCNYMAREEV